MVVFYELVRIRILWRLQSKRDKKTRKHSDHPYGLRGEKCQKFPSLRGQQRTVHGYLNAASVERAELMMKEAII